MSDPDLERLDAAIAHQRAAIARFEPTATRPDELAQAFPLGVGRMTAAQAKRRQQAHDRQRRAFAALREARGELQRLEILRTNYLAGECHINGQPRADSPSRQRAAAWAAAYTAWVRSVVKPGNQVEMITWASAALRTVKRLNFKSVSIVGTPSCWAYADVRPLHANGERMTDQEVRAAVQPFLKEHSHD